MKNDTDTALFEHKIVVQYTHLYQYALSLCGNTENAEDLVQETLLKALINQDKFRMDTNLCAWLCTIMKNLFINDYYHFQRIQPVQPIDRYCQEIPGPFRTDDLYDIRLINRAISELEESERTVFVLYLLAYKYEEIARRQHIPVGTVKSKIYYIRKKLQNRLKELGED